MRRRRIVRRQHAYAPYPSTPVENPRTGEQWAFMLGGAAIALGGVAYVVTDPGWPLGPNFLHGMFGPETPQEQAQDAAALATYQQRQLIGQAIALLGFGFVATMAWRTRQQT